MAPILSCPPNNPCHGIGRNFIGQIITDSGYTCESYGKCSSGFKDKRRKIVISE